MANELIILAYGIFIGLGYALPAGWLFFSPFRRTKMMRFITKKNYAIVNFKYGNNLLPVIKNLDGDVIRAFDGIWILQGGKIYHQVAEEKGSEMIKIKAATEGQEPNMKKLTIRGKTVFVEKTPKKLTASSISFKQGVPTLFLDMNDMMPLKFENEPVEEGVSRIPSQVEATLSKEVSSAEAEAMKMTKENMMKQLKIILIIAFVAAAIGALSIYMNVTLTQTVTERFDSIAAAINAIPKTV